MTYHHFLTLVSSLALAAVVFLLIWWGWRGRARRQSDVVAPPEFPAELGSTPAEWSGEAQYVSTTTAGDWLDRIAAHGLGMKANGTVLVLPQGVAILRQGADELWIPAESILVLRRESGMAGKFVEKDGLAVITWRLGDRAVDTGLRTRYARDTEALLAALRRIAPEAGQDLPAEGFPDTTDPITGPSPRKQHA